MGVRWGVGPPVDHASDPVSLSWMRAPPAAAWRRDVASSRAGVLAASSRCWWQGCRRRATRTCRRSVCPESRGLDHSSVKGLDSVLSGADSQIFPLPEA